MSKANQTFKQNEDAVSPAIGVILMVAITVVLAAVVFVLVSNLSKNSNTAAPNITFNQDNSGHTLTIVSADAAANWQNVKETITGGCNVKLNSGATMATGTSITSASQAIAAGDVLTVAGSTGSSCTISLTYTTVNQLLGSWTFTF
jgi:FlaG/FlaF family flagellin (archaellin)